MSLVFDQRHFGAGYRCLRLYRVYDPRGVGPHPITRVVDPVSQRDGGRFQKMKSCNDYIFWCRIHEIMQHDDTELMKYKSCDNLYVVDNQMLFSMYSSYRIRFSSNIFFTSSMNVFLL